MVWYDTVYVFVSKVKKLAHLLLITVFFFCIGTCCYMTLSHTALFCVRMQVLERGCKKKESERVQAKPWPRLSQMESMQLISSISAIEQKRRLKNIVIDFYACYAAFF